MVSVIHTCRVFLLASVIYSSTGVTSATNPARVRVSATLGMRQLNTSFWGAMQRTADAIDHITARAVCMDFFEDLGETHCGEQAPHPPGPPSPPTPPAPTPPAPTFVDFDFGANWSSGGPATTLPTSGFGVRKVEFIYYEPDGITYAYADIINYTDPYYPESCTHNQVCWMTISGSNTRQHAIELACSCCSYPRSQFHRR